MKALILFIILPSFFSPPSKNSETLSQSFSINHFTSSLIIDVNGSVEIKYWDKGKMHVETTVTGASPTLSNYPLQYAINKGYYDLICVPNDDVTTLVLKSKKINSTIYQYGKEQKTKQTFLIFIPKGLQCIIN